MKSVRSAFFAAPFLLLPFAANAGNSEAPEDKTRSCNIRFAGLTLCQVTLVHETEKNLVLDIDFKYKPKTWLLKSKRNGLTIKLN